MVDSSGNGERWTITVCPACGKHIPFSGLAAVHGGSPVCSCTAELVTDSDGFAKFEGNTDLVAVEVAPVDPDWRERHNA